MEHENSTTSVEDNLLNIMQVSLFYIVFQSKYPRMNVKKVFFVIQRTRIYIYIYKYMVN